MLAVQALRGDKHSRSIRAEEEAEGSSEEIMEDRPQEREFQEGRSLR